ncbi:MAG TPA: hypothetical protein VG734_08575 [Lacunisphaera sp.]|nr:hypothetical protein [Lacunisphaera sp.]
MIDYDSVRQRIAAFDKKNGGDGVEINGAIYYSNGAIRDTEPLGALIDPPRDPQERCKIQLSYWQELQRRAVAEFDEVKSQYLTNAKVGLTEAFTPALPWTEAQAVKKLTELRDNVRELQKRVTAARAELKRNTPQEVLDRRAHFSAARQMATAFVEAVESIKI